MLYTALLIGAAFLLGLRAGLALGYRAERGRRIVNERKWLGEIGRALGVRPTQAESVDALRERILDQALEVRAIEQSRDRAPSDASREPAN